MTEKYLKGILKIKTFWNMKSTPFDNKKFYQDVKRVFEFQSPLVSMFSSLNNNIRLGIKLLSEFYPLKLETLFPFEHTSSYSVK